MSAPTQSLDARFRSLVGGRARPATEADGVAGVTPQLVLEPATEDEVAAALAAADGQGLKVLLRGGGTQLNLGFPPEGGDILLSTAGMAQVLDYNPHDLTVTVQAGMRLTSLQHVLGRERQSLALDPLLPEPATIGGMIATNASGTRRIRYGGVRDQIIGVRVVLADGTIAKGGGKVVKNVAGYDLPKLFTGSLGTLGAIVAATFRLYPLPAASRTVVLTAADPLPLCDLALRINGSTLEPTMMDVCGPDLRGPGSMLAVRFQTTPQATDDQAGRLVKLAGDLGITAQILSGDEEASPWQQVADTLAPAGSAQTSVVLKVNVLPTAVAGWVASLLRVAAASGLDARYDAYVGLGTIFVRLSGALEALVAAVESLRRAAGPVPECGSLVVWDAPPEVTRQVDVWGPSATLDLMRRVKRAFDPNATLNPGRFVGRI